MNKLIVLLIGFCFLIFNISPIEASSSSLTTSAIQSLSALNENKQEEKIKKLTSFLKERNSPLAAYARVIVEQAEENDLDWRLITAIAGVESNFGKIIPFNSYNAYGWANGNYVFESWEHGIVVVSKTLNEKYRKQWKAETVEQIGRYYAASPTWASRVLFFMKQIENTSLKPTDLDLNL